MNHVEVPKEYLIFSRKMASREAAALFGVSGLVVVLTGGATAGCPISK